MTTSKARIRGEDLAEMLMGGMALAYPVALTEEAWNVGADLSWTNIAILLATSIGILGWYGYHAFHRDDFRHTWPHWLARIVTVYALTAAISAGLLLVLGKWPILSDPVLAIRRTVIVAFPAVFTATIVDSLR